MFKNTKRLLVTAAVTLVGALGYGIVIPILYPYSVKYGLSDFENGVLFSVFSICQFISTPIIGMLSDKYGRKPLLVISLIGTAFSFLIMAFAPNALFLFLARALDGFTAGNLPVAQAIISDTTSGKDRARGFGIIGACFGVGFIAGPTISAFTVGISLKLPFIIAAILSAIAVIMAIILLDETNTKMAEIKNKKLFDWRKLFSSIFEKNIGLTLLITFFWAFAFGMFIYAFQPFSTKVLLLKPQHISLIFVLFGVIGFLSQIFLVGRLTKILGVLKAFNLALITLTISFILLFFTKNLYWLIFASIIMALSNSTVQTLTQTVLSEETPLERQGEIMGVNASYMSIGQIIGPMVAGALTLIAINYPFLMGGFFIFIAYIISTKIVLPKHN